MKAALPLCLFLFAALPAMGQDSQTAPIAHSEEIAQTVEDWGTEVTITADVPGPALWKIKKGDAEVYIMGSMPVMVKRYAWDRARMERIMDRANVFITSPQLTGGVVSFATWQVTRSLGGGRDLYEILPARLSLRFRTLVAKNGLDFKKYAKMDPIVAATTLKDDVYAAHNLTSRDPEKAMIFMARDRKTPMRPMALYKASDLIKRLKKYSEAEQITCVVKTLNEIDFALGHAEAASAAWATGDLEGVKANMPYSSAMSCLEGAATTSGLVDDAVGQAVGVINEALRAPSKTVMVLPLSVLLRKGGAFEQLKAQGAEISVPE